MGSRRQGGKESSRWRLARLRTSEKIVSALGKYGIGLLVGSPASIGNILKDGLSPIPASIEIWVLVAPIFRGTQQLFTPPRNFEVLERILGGFERF